MFQPTRPPVRWSSGHRRDQQHRVVHRHLHAAAQRRVGMAAVDVVHAHHVGQEDAVEQRRLQRAGHLGPVGQGVVAGGLVTRVRPQALLDVADTVHVEGVEQDLAGHG
jgi:hypothetical protein